MVLVRQETEAEAEAGTGDVQTAQARSLMKGDAVVIVRIEAAALDKMLLLVPEQLPEQLAKQSRRENSASERRKPADVGPLPTLIDSLSNL
jgi:hypothetical protein